MDKRTVTVLCKPTRLRIGHYFPAEFEILNATVALNVPFTEENFDNYQDIEQMRGAVDVPPELTVAGFQWCYNQLRDALTIEPEDVSADFDRETGDGLDTALADEEWID